MTRPASTNDLRPSERQLMTAMSQLGFGRFEFLRVERGEVVLNPWPCMIRDVKFGLAANRNQHSADFELRKQVAEFFEYVRSVDAGEIRTLEVQNGLPFSMEIEQRSCTAGGRLHA